MSRATLPQVAVPHVAGHVNPSRRTLALDRVRCGYDGNVGDFAQRHVTAGGSLDQAVAHGRQVAANFRHTPDGHFVDLLLSVDFTDRSTFDQRRRRSADVAGSQSELLGGSGFQPDIQLRDQHLLFDLQIADAFDVGDRLSHSGCVLPQTMRCRRRRCARQYWHWRRSALP